MVSSSIWKCARMGTYLYLYLSSCMKREHTTARVAWSPFKNFVGRRLDKIDCSNFSYFSCIILFFCRHNLFLCWPMLHVLTYNFWMNKKEQSHTFTFMSARQILWQINRPNYSLDIRHSLFDFLLMCRQMGRHKQECRSKQCKGYSDSPFGTEGCTRSDR